MAGKHLARPEYSAMKLRDECSAARHEWKGTRTAGNRAVCEVHVAVTLSDSGCHWQGCAGQQERLAAFLTEQIRQQTHHTWLGISEYRGSSQNRKRPRERCLQAMFAQRGHQGHNSCRRPHRPKPCIPVRLLSLRWYLLAWSGSAEKRRYQTSGHLSGAWANPLCAPAWLCALPWSELCHSFVISEPT